MNWLKHSGVFLFLLFGSCFSMYAQEAEMENASVSPGPEEIDTVVIRDVHPQDSPEDRGFLITSKDRKSSLRIRGSIRLSGGYDLNGLQNKNTFSTYDIPVGDDNVDELRYFMSINQTRLGIEAKRETAVGEVFMRVESDFMGSNSTPRLRHVYGSTNHWLVGQTWSVFGDVASLPNTVDLDGPNSSLTARTVQIRYSGRIKESLNYAIAAEAPKPDIVYPDSLVYQQAFQSFPDISFRFRWQKEQGHLQVAGMLRSISGKDNNNEPYYLVGYGALFSGNVSFKERASLLFQAYAGSAISRFITGLTGKGLDAVYNPNTGIYEPLGSIGGYTSFGYAWAPELNSFFTAGLIDIANKDFQQDDEMSFTYYFSGNIFWSTRLGTRMGIEYSWGRRTNIDGQSGDANRISFIFYYDF